MATDLKRSATDEDGFSPLKRPRPDSPSIQPDQEIEDYQKPTRPNVDPWTGQRVAFPGLDDAADDEIFYGPPGDGLEYLRMVRSEAKSVPSLLVAPQAANSDVTTGEGYYKDGAYTARPSRDVSSSVGGPAAPVHEPSEVERSYHQDLILKFRLMRANLRCIPYQEGQEDENSAPTGTDAGSDSWDKLRRAIFAGPPSLAQVASLDQPLVLRALSLLGQRAFSKTRNVSPAVSQWIWALLAQVEDVGCLGSEEVAVLRELGKRSGSLCRQARLLDSDRTLIHGAAGTASDIDSGSKDHADADSGQDMDGVDQESLNEDDDDEVSAQDSNLLPEDILAAKKQLLLEMMLPQSRSDQSLGPLQRTKSVEAFPSENTRATLDYILTIVGELYGQRDLLVHRHILWEE